MKTEPETEPEVEIDPDAAARRVERLAAVEERLITAWRLRSHFDPGDSGEVLRAARREVLGDEPRPRR